MLGPHLLRKSEHLVGSPRPPAPRREKRENIGSDGGARSASIGDEAAVLPSRHSPTSETERRSSAVVSWSPTAACFPPRPIRFLPSAYPPHPPIREKILHCRAQRGRNHPLRPVRDTLASVLIRRKIGDESPLRHRSSAVLFEICSRRKRQPVSHRERKALRGGVININHYVDAKFEFRHFKPSSTYSKHPIYIPLSLLSHPKCIIVQ